MWMPCYPLTYHYVDQEGRECEKICWKGEDVRDLLFTLIWHGKDKNDSLGYGIVRVTNRSGEEVTHLVMATKEHERVSMSGVIDYFAEQIIDDREDPDSWRMV